MDHYVESQRDQIENGIIYNGQRNISVKQFFEELAEQKKRFTDHYNKYHNKIEQVLSKHRYKFDEKKIKEEIREISTRPEDEAFVIDVYCYLKEAINKDSRRALDHYRKLFYDDIENFYGSDYAIELALGLEGVDEYYGCRTENEYDTLISDLKHHAEYTNAVLIVGETGTGKQLIAQTIHTISKRRKGPFVEINCAAIPESLMESELFGVEEGYPGLQSPIGLIGKIELANNGVLFLDELGKSTKNIQSKILKVIDDNKIFRIGSQDCKFINVQFIAAVHPDDLNDRVLSDLKYRFGFPDVIRMKSLNDKLNQFGRRVISVTLERILQKIGMDSNITDQSFRLERGDDYLHLRTDAGSIMIDESCLDMMVNYRYEGNYRELENILKMAIRSAMRNKRTLIEKDDFQNVLLPEASPQTKSPDDSPRAYSDINLKDLIPYANQKRADIVRNKILALLKSNSDLKSAFIKEGLPEKEYQNFWKKVTKIMGKGIRDLAKEALCYGKA